MSSEAPAKETRVYRRDVALPVPAFDMLKALQREWGLRTNADTLSRLLLTQGPQCLTHLRHEDDDATR